MAEVVLEHAGRDAELAAQVLEAARVLPEEGKERPASRRPGLAGAGAPRPRPAPVLLPVAVPVPVPLAFSFSIALPQRPSPCAGSIVAGRG